MDFKMPGHGNTVCDSSDLLKQPLQLGSDSQYPELHVVFDFFADNPQKVMPGAVGTSSAGGLSLQQGVDGLSVGDHSSGIDGGSSGGASAGRGGTISGVMESKAVGRENPFYDPYWESIRLMQENELFMEGMLLRSVDCKPNFPYMHYIIYKTPTSSSSLVSGIKQHHSMTSSLLGEITTPNGRYANDANRQFVDILRSRGGYIEMHTFIDRRTPLLPKRPSNPNAAYIVSAFKTAGNLDSLDRTWTYWSGADYIVENIPKALRLERVTFHKLKHGHEKGNFSYVLLCEVAEALSDLNRAREFIDTLKYRQCGVTSLYVIDHFF